MRSPKTNVLVFLSHSLESEVRRCFATEPRRSGTEPGDAAVLLALGVSHVNEVHAGAAVSFLMRCAL